ncbi:MAG: helix-turn-helix transcriptional regulator [Rhodospirillaceae bacterium]|nr:helix-turn-helix transcriptional regulator [Rhodospirillaceae bacterium]
MATTMVAIAIFRAGMKIRFIDEAGPRTDAMESDDTAVERGSGNVFADLGFPDADAHLVKAELVSRIDDIVRQRGITQTEAARLLGLSQPDVSRLLRGDFREYSLERLFRLLTTLGRDIEIVVRQPHSAGGGRLRIAAEPA